MTTSSEPASSPASPGASAVRPAGTYELKMSRLTWGEIWRHSSDVVQFLLGALLFKVLRLDRLAAGNVVQYPVHLDIETPESLPGWATAALGELGELLEARRFARLGLRSMTSGPHTSYVEVWLHASGMTFAQAVVTPAIQGGTREKRFLVTSSGRDGAGRFLCANKPLELDGPADLETLWLPELSPEALLERHQQELDRREGPFTALRVEEVWSQLQRDNDRGIEHLIDRGVYALAKAGLD